MSSKTVKNTTKKTKGSSKSVKGAKNTRNMSTGAPKLTKAEQRKLEEKNKMLRAEVFSIAVLSISVLIFICVIASERMGIVGGYVSAGLKHLFGIGALILPIVLMVFSVQTLMDKTKYAYKFKFSLFIGFFVTVICLFHVFSYRVGLGDIAFSQYISDSFLNGDVKNGGLVGALIGGVLCSLLGKTGTTVLLVAAGVILIILATGKTVADFLGAIGDWIDGTKEEFKEYRDSHIILDEQEYYDDREQSVQMELPVDKMERKHNKNSTRNNKSLHKPVHNPVYIDIPEEENAPEDKVIIDTELFAPKAASDEEPAMDIPSFIKEDMEQYEEIFAVKKEVTKDDNEDDNEDDEDLKEPEIPKLHFTNEEEEISQKFIDVSKEQEDDGHSADVVNIEEKNEEKDMPPWEDEENGLEIIEAEKTKEVKKLDTKTSTPYKFPSPDILARNPHKKGVTNRDELIKKSKLLEETLATFGVNAKVVNVSQGPAVTRYELIPPKGIPISRITKLDKDIELALAAKSVRIEAPIPGTNRIGIELGNDSVSVVYFSEVLLTDKFRDYKSKLAFGVGKDITGTVIVADIADMTHLLIAGATGTGKSVCINTLITSLLYKATPDEVKLILIDPKKVELSVYNGIPHLLIPVVTDVQKAAGALNWAIREMERRYDLLEKYGVRNIKGYNKLEGIEKLPYIVIVIDELADLMMTTGKEVENAIVRLTQLARAAGMHLVIATQRPDANIVTGLIKANVPSRIAFKVAGSVNSKIILDATGAEKLLGRGDMLLKTRAFDDKPLRIQGAFVTDEEVEEIVNSIKTDGDHYDKSVIDEIDRAVAEAHGEEGQAQGTGDGSDDLIEDVIKLVAIQQKASTSFIQRKFKIGYNRAARIIDELEERGIVGPDMGGTKGREVKIDKYQYNEWKNRRDDYDDM